jgi:parvulin-like peptidyl-prolyl isomerase
VPALLSLALCALAVAPADLSGRQAEDSSEYVATFDGGGITVEQFREEFDRAMVKYSDYDITGYSDKAQVLAKMADRILMAREAKERGFVDEEGKWDPKIIEVRELAMVNQLRRDVILKGVTVTEEEIRDLYDRSDIRRLTRTISVSNEVEAKLIEKRLAEGADFVELAKERSLDVGSASWEAMLAWVKIGDGPEEAERFIEDLKLGEIGGPLLDHQGYYFFRVDSLYYKEDLASYEDLKPRLRTVALARNRTPVRVAFMDSVAGACGVRHVYETIDLVAERFQSDGWIEDDDPGRASRVPTFSPQELGTPIFEFEGGSHTLEEYIEYVEDMHINPAYYMAGREEIERGMKGFVRKKLELHLAYEMGMDEVRGVRGVVRARAEEKGITDMLVDAAGGDESIHSTEEERRAFYEENEWKYTEPGALVLTMVTVTSDEVYDQLHEDMSEGMSFSRIAEDYRWVLDDDLTAERMVLTNDEKEDHPEVFHTARRMKVGEVSEPIPVHGVGFTVIKLLEREPSRVIPYEEVKNEVRTDLNLERLTAAAERMEEFRVGVRKKYNYRVNEELLKSIQP